MPVGSKESAAAMCLALSLLVSGHICGAVASLSRFKFDVLFHQGYSGAHSKGVL